MIKIIVNQEKIDATEKNRLSAIPIFKIQSINKLLICTIIIIQFLFFQWITEKEDVL